MNRVPTDGGYGPVGTGICPLDHAGIPTFTAKTIVTEGAVQVASVGSGFVGIVIVGRAVRAMTITVRATVCGIRVVSMSSGSPVITLGGEEL